MAGLRVGKAFAEDEKEKTPAVLSGPFPQVGSRQIRPRAVRGEHVAPGTLNQSHFEDDFVTHDTLGDGEYWQVGDLQHCSHTTATSSGSVTWTYPKAFSVNPTVVVTAQGAAAVIATVDSISTTSVVIRTFDDAGAATDATVEVIAIGTKAAES